MNKEAIKLIGFFVVIIMLISTASAFAISSKYWEEYPLVIYPGQTIEGVFVLQNLGGDEALNVQGTITEGGEFASFVSDSNIFVVPKGEKLNVYYLVSISEEAIIGDINNLIFSFKTVVNSENGGPLGFSGGVERVIPLSVIAEPIPEKNGLFWWAWLLIALAVVAIVIWAIKFKKKSKKK